VNARRHLDAVDRALTPTETVLAVIDEARTYPDMATYVRAWLEGDREGTLLDLVIERAASAARSRHRGRTGIRAAVRVAVRDTALLFHLALLLNDETERLAQEAALRSFAMQYLLRAMLDDLPEGISPDEADEADEALERDPLRRWEQWRDDVDAQVFAVRCHDAALRSLERGHFLGRSVLLDGPAEAWAATKAQYDAIHAFAKYPPAPLRPLSRRPRRRKQWDLVEGGRLRALELWRDARKAAFSTMGETSQVRALAEEQLRAR